MHLTTGLKQLARDVNYFSLSSPMSLVKVYKNTCNIYSIIPYSCYGHPLFPSRKRDRLPTVKN